MGPNVDKGDPACPLCRKALVKGVVQRERPGGRVAVYEALICPVPKYVHARSRLHGISTEGFLGLAVNATILASCVTGPGSMNSKLTSALEEATQLSAVLTAATHGTSSRCLSRFESLFSIASGS